MAEANTVDVEAKVDAAFGAAFGGTEPAPPVTKIAEEPVVAPPAADGAVPAPGVAQEKPKYARVTQDEWNNTKAAAGKVANLESQLAKLTGNAPNSDKIAQQVLEQLSSQTPAGMTVELSDEDFAEMAADFPELARLSRSVLEKVIKKAQIKGTGPAAPPAPSVDVNSVTEQVRLRLEEGALNKAYPNWSEIVGRPPTPEAPVPDGNPFRVWLAKQRPEYQKAVNETDSPADIQEAIASFKVSQTAVATPPAADKAAARRAVIEDAVTPRADGNPPPLNKPQTAEEAFGNAFKSVKAH